MEELIIFNECFNEDGKHIHLYRNRETGVWMAYGYSAYKKVAEIQHRSDHPLVQHFSEKMLMLAVVVGNDLLEDIANGCCCKEQNQDYTRLALTEPARTGTAGYRKWAQNLRGILNR